MSEELDETLCKQISGLVQLLATSGKPTLNPEVMKKLKKLCRNSDGYVKYAFDLLMKQLHIKHSEVRLSVCQMIDELFLRSHVFRELLLENIHTYIDLSTGLDKSLPLPPPKQVAKAMKDNVLRNIYLWFEKYGPAYKKLALGYDFLKTCKKVDFDGIAAAARQEREQQADTERKMEAIRCEKLQHAVKQFEDNEPEIELCVTQVENGLELLLPKPDEFFIPVDVNQGQEMTSSVSVTSSETLRSSEAVTSQPPSDSAVSYLTKTNSSENACDNFDNINSVYNRNCRNRQIPPLETSHKLQNTTVVDSSNSANSAGNVEPASPTSSDSGDDSEDGTEDLSLGQHHGVFSRQFALTITIGGPENTTLQETEDNAAIIEGIQDQYRLIKNKYLPHVKTWLKTLIDNKSETSKIEQLTRWRVRLETAVKKCLELEIKASRRNRDDSDTDDDDDFEEVPDKCGYEKDIPEHVKLEAAMTSAGNQTGSRKRSVRKAAAGKKKLKQSAEDLLAQQRKSVTHDIAIHNEVNKEKHDVEPSTSQEGSEKNVNQSSSSSSSCSHSQTGTSHPSDRKQSLLEKAPVVPFGVDIEHWENPDHIKAPSKVKYENASRFWVADKDEDLGRELAGTSEEVASLTRRTFTYVGDLPPVKWKCRALLANGKLCERMDREKCPFHGRIIGRDKEGQPTKPADIERLTRERILREIEEGFEDSDSDGAQGSKGKGNGKRPRKRKYPNLTDIRETETSRSRLEAKIFNRSTLKKVNDALDAAAMKKLSDKFGHQFNYSLN